MGRHAAGLALGAGAAVMVGRAFFRARRHYDLLDRTVLITGGSRGLGLALARQFAVERARIALCARDEEELEEARKELAARGTPVFAATCDVTVQEEVERFVRDVRNAFGEIDVLVNNAGVIEVGPLASMKREDFQEAMDTHFYGPLHFALAVMPDMRRRRHGRIVNISSLAGLIAIPHVLPWSTSKFALTGLSEGLRAELAHDNVLVTTVCPARIRTASHLHATFKGHALDEYRWFSTGGSMPGLAISPERLARRIVRACVHGRAMLVVPIRAKIASRIHALFPETTSDLLDLVDRLLPRSLGALPEGRVEGADLEPPRGGSFLNRLNRFTAIRLNEYAR